MWVSPRDCLMRWAMPAMFPGGQPDEQSRCPLHLDHPGLRHPASPVRAPLGRPGGVTVVFFTHGVPPVVRIEAADWGLVVIEC
jgi:hypothetical protein